jgi:DNA-binding IclR family transcriptional regulator
VRCLSVGIKDYSGKYVAGISVSGPTTRMTMDYIQKFKQIVIDAADKISNHLAYKKA